MAVREYEFYLQVLKVSLTCSLCSIMRDTFSTCRSNLYPQAAMLCSVYFCQQCICPSLDHWYKPVKMDGCITQVIEKSQWCKKKRDNYTVNSLNACPSTQFSTNDTPCLNIQ